MANKALYLSNTGTAYGPLEISNFAPGGRALILGRQLDLSAIPNIRHYFSLIIAEDQAYSSGLTSEPDIVIWQPGSPYINGVFSFPDSKTILYMVNRSALKKCAGAGISTGTYNLSYLPGGTKSSQPSIINYIPAGLDPLAPGQHIAMIAGITSFYDTEGRSGTTLATKESITQAVNEKNKYGVSNFFLQVRYSLIERI